MKLTKRQRGSDITYLVWNNNDDNTEILPKNELCYKNTVCMIYICSSRYIAIQHYTTHSKPSQNGSTLFPFPFSPTYTHFPNDLTLTDPANSLLFSTILDLIYLINDCDTLTKKQLKLAKRLGVFTLQFQSKKKMG